ncbi:arylamine n-acetyltransferase 3 [Fusarium langsethiae]|uniref:Tpa: arylamine n-acetyltransferase 3 n=1 Tax=Fusarium langsethiae TaxID=179993 RepID=A0A0M9EPG8_FUSLA|nr:arylamine n-acetyltransferase 3 [Fusarium langsethiae]
MEQDHEVMIVNGPVGLTSGDVLEKRIARWAITREKASGFSTVEGQPTCARTIPFENLTLHYSRPRFIDVHLSKVFEKVVQSTGRGGYCMELNSLFNTLLVSLGYDAYLVPSRVFDRSNQRYNALTHCLSIVVVGVDRYAVDVGFGGNVATVPLRLGTLAHPSQARIRVDTLSMESSSHTKYWIYEHRSNDQEDWSIQYCLLDLELSPEDLEVLNLGPSTSRTSFFTQKVLCVKLTGGNEFYAKFTMESGAQRLHNENDVGYVEGDVIDGVLILDGAVLKWRKRGVKQWEVILKTEEERTRALEDIFGIHLSTEEKESILRTASALIDHPGRFRK